MSTTANIIIGGAAIVVVGLLLSKKSHAAPAHSQAPSPTAPPVPPPTPGAGATTSVVPASSAIPFALTRTDWKVAADASGQQPGTYSLFQNSENASDWVLAFTAANAKGAGIMTYGSTKNSGLIAQAIASIA